jgi:hypothetical protein
VDCANLLCALLQVALSNRAHPVHESILSTGLGKSTNNCAKRGKCTNHDEPIGGAAECTEVQPPFKDKWQQVKPRSPLIPG